MQGRQVPRHVLIDDSSNLQDLVLRELLRHIVYSLVVIVYLLIIFLLIIIYFYENINLTGFWGFGGVGRAHV